MDYFMVRNLNVKEFGFGAHSKEEAESWIKTDYPDVSKLTQVLFTDLYRVTIHIQISGGISDISGYA